MPKEKPLQGGPIRGSDTLKIPEIGYNGTIPVAAVNELEREAAGIIHGTIVLSLHIKDGNLIRFATSRERSFVPGKPTTGAAFHEDERSRNKRS